MSDDSDEDPHFTVSDKDLLNCSDGSEDGIY